jgi:hypothetical protein
MQTAKVKLQRTEQALLTWMSVGLLAKNRCRKDGVITLKVNYTQIRKEARRRRNIFYPYIARHELTADSKD